MKRIILIILAFFVSCHLFADYVRGKVTDESGKALSFANVYVKNTSYGVSTNSYGNYFIELRTGTHILVYSYMGYETKEMEVVISAGKPLTLNVSLKVEAHTVSEVVVGVEEVDRAKVIMQEVRKNRKVYLDQINSYECLTYIKTNLEKDVEIKEEADSIDMDSLLKDAEDMKALLQRERMNLIESISRTYYMKPSTYREMVQAYHNYTVKREYFPPPQVSWSMSYGNTDIVPTLRYDENPNVIYKDISSCDFNFYDNLISFPSLTPSLILSPIASTSSLSYKYEFLGSFYEDNQKIFKIQIQPVFKGEALFSGYLFVEDSTWVLKAVDLTLDKQFLSYCNEFRIIQNYKQISPGIYLPVRREIIYGFKEKNVSGITRVHHSDYKVNELRHLREFKNEVKKYGEDAFNKDTTYWKQNRPLHLKVEELEFVYKCDSIKEYFESEEYFRKQDSVFNRLHPWIWLTGVGHRNRAKGTEWYLGGLLQQINVFGIGGYRHKLPFYINQSFKNGMHLNTDEFIDYGFGNGDIKWRIGVGLTYKPLKFMRTYVQIGDVYEMINTYSSFEQVFSMSNYVRTKTVTVKQRMEITNGLYGELTFDYSDQDPLTDLQLSKWSEYIFGDINKPSDFVRYKKTEVKLELQYLINQKYVIRNNRKIILGSDYPTLYLVYRKGIPELFGSEVNFDFLELGCKGELDFKRFGYSKWHVTGASFMNKKNLRNLEYKYFRGSDRYVFSDPINSFQLLGPTFLTNNSYFKINYIHHFNGTALGKIPLISRLKIQPAVGAGSILIPSENFYHFEMFGGLERSFTLWKQLFRIGLYAVTSDSNIDKADYSFKIGLDFFNSFLNKWNY